MVVDVVLIVMANQLIMEVWCGLLDHVVLNALALVENMVKKNRSRFSIAVLLTTLIRSR